MREDICSIPVNEVFEPKDGCPFCRMRDMLEDRMATYITGAAMMEPDVRIETNRLGFCAEHFNQILARGSRLSVALILESLLAEVKGQVFPEGKTPAKKITAAVHSRQENCFICENIDKNMKHLLDSTVTLWQAEEEFRQLYAAQPYICLPHYGLSLEAAQKMPKKNFIPFEAATTKLAKGYLEELSGDVTHFCRMFDYRSAGGDWGNSRDSIERAMEWLTARPTVAQQNSGEKNR
ncbi:hypothetical protein D7X94_09900 [Acutalibacter sp. 1XD8-33]|uniref:DUF6062 family protein n=1 Tax=Acutalibacter sp. 1XD8-33 TaxID=2320081 RepID=UPI000EA3EF4F|nr:DUF6062 family protein [Acutalibacter sp. 1XD8-33]RKJ39935.1 hypothetical protein D7X94_09900 [Acutalibacter sp. 1XD8-33]